MPFITGRSLTHFFATLFFLLPLSSQPAEPHPSSDLESYLSKVGYAGVPFKKNENDQPLLEVELAGRHHVFLADTGCTMTTLQPAAAAGLKTLGELGVSLVDSFLGPITNSQIALMSELHLGRAKLMNQPAVVEKLDMDFVHLPFDGILGLDFFFRNFCLIDCYERKLYLRGSRPSEQISAAFEESLHRSGFTDVPFEPRDMISIPCRINGELAHLLVDTGDGVSVLDQTLADRLHLKPVRMEDPEKGSLIRPTASGDLVGFNRIGTHKTWVTMLGSLEIASRRWKNLSYGVTDLRAWKLLDEENPEQGLQGMFGEELLTTRGALIDFANRKLWFRPDRHGAK